MFEKIKEQFKKEEIAENFNCEVYNPRKVSWEEIKDDILRIELSAFSEEKAFDEKILKRDFEDPDSVIVLMINNVTNKIIGFSYAKPTIKVYPEDFPNREANEDTAYIYDTALEESYQGKKLVKNLLDKIDTELVNRGFSFIERDSADYLKDEKSENNKKETYADKIRKNYQDRIIKEEMHDSEFGPQVFFRMSLKKPEKMVSSVNEKFIKMPYVRQENDYYCGPAVLQMILEKFGVKKSQKEIAQAANSTLERGTFHRDMCRMAKENNLYVYAKKNATIEEIEKLVDQGFPVVVNYIEPEGDGHYAIVIGYGTDDLIFNDPYHGEKFRFPKKEFKHRWHNIKKLLIVGLW